MVLNNTKYGLVPHERAHEVVNQDCSLTALIEIKNSLGQEVSLGNLDE